MSCLIYTYVEYVASTQNEISKVCARRVASVFGRSVQDDVHVAVAVYHLSSILDVVLQSDEDVSVQLLDQEV